MSEHINRIILQGNLVSDPELKEFPSSKVCKFTIATNRNRDEVNYTEVAAWRELADYSMSFLKKGTQCIVEGRLKLETWLSRDGRKMSKFVVVASEVIYLPRRPDDEVDLEEDVK